MGDSGDLVGRRYRLIRPIGKGGMGIVYQAYDRLTGQMIALKQVTAPGPMLQFSTVSKSTDYRLSLAQEFKILASLRHPNIISVLDYGFTTTPGETAEKLPYFTMDLLENAQIVTAAAQDKSQTERIDLLIQVLQALVYLHRRKILHRDLKPANVLVENHFVRVVDFGLSVARKHPGEAGNDAMGTLAYMAPEVLQGAPASEASDLYAVGMITYELLAGKHPFDTNKVTNLIKDTLLTKPDISILDVNVEMAATIAALLAKNPAERIQDAGDLIDIYVRSSADLAGLKKRDTHATRESFLQAAQFIGRDHEFSLLNATLNRAMQGESSAWLIGGESGVGKSRLLEELRTVALVAGVSVLRGQAVSEGGILYTTWREVIRRLALMTTLTDEEASVLKSAIADISTLIDREVADAPELDPQASQRRFLDVVQAVLVRVMREENQPLLIILEDIHWAGSESLSLLNDLTARMIAWPLMIIASYRNDERMMLPADLPKMKLLTLERLTEADIAALSESMLGEAGRLPEVVDLFKAETEGNVFFMVEVARALADDAGQLDQIGSKTLPRNIFAGGIKLVMRRRLNRIPIHARPLLFIAAVAGRQIDLELLRTIDPKIDLTTWLNTCAACAVLEVDDSGSKDGGWRFAHDRLRESLLADFPAADRRDLHRRVAEAIETIYSDPAKQASRLAYHWGMAGDKFRELMYIGMAGQQAIRSSANPEAIDYFTRALELLAEIPDFPGKAEQELNLLIALGVSTMAVKGYGAPEVERAYSRARDVGKIVGETPLMINVLANLSGYYIARADYRAASNLGLEMLFMAENLQSSMGEMWGHLILGQTVGFMGEHEAALRHLETMVEKFDFTRRRRSIQANAVQDIGVAALNFLAITSWVLGYPDKALSYSLRAIEFAEFLEHPISIVFAKHWTSTLQYFRGEYAECRRFAEATISLAEEKNYGLFLLLAKIFHAASGVHLGEPVDDALKQMQTALTAYRASGAEFCVAFFLGILADMQARSGQIGEAQKTLDEALELVERYNEVWCQSELLRLKGELILLQTQQENEAEAAFLQSIEFARQRNARTPALRTAIRLARLWQAQGQKEQACDLLANHYTPFTEGFDTTDLREAQRLLSELT